MAPISPTLDLLATGQRSTLPPCIFGGRFIGLLFLSPSLMVEGGVRIVSVTSWDPQATLLRMDIPSAKSLMSSGARATPLGRALAAAPKRHERALQTSLRLLASEASAWDRCGNALNRTTQVLPSSGKDRSVKHGLLELGVGAMPLGKSCEHP